MVKKIIILLGFLIILTITYGVYTYNKPHKNVLDSKEDVSMTSKELIIKFSKDSETSNTLFSNKIILASGNISLVEKSKKSTILILDNGVKFEINNNLISDKKFTIDQFIKIKGLYSGFDEMFNEISLIQCSIQD
jgi:hypothetical protein